MDKDFQVSDEPDDLNDDPEAGQQAAMPSGRRARRVRVNDNVFVSIFTSHTKCSLSQLAKRSYTGKNFQSRFVKFLSNTCRGAW